MRVVMSVDMEGISQLSRAREIVAACPEYWETGRPRYEEEVAAACEGLLAGGATDVVVLDNHGSGNPANIGVVQRSAGHGAAEPVAGPDAVREFARACAENAGDVPPVAVPEAARLAASMPNGADVEAAMREGGFARTGEVEYEIELESWEDAREPVGAAMLAAMAPLLGAWSTDLTSSERASAYDRAKREELGAAIDAWGDASGPEWFS